MRRERKRDYAGAFDVQYIVNVGYFIFSFRSLYGLFRQPVQKNQNNSSTEKTRLNAQPCQGLFLCETNSHGPKPPTSFQIVYPPNKEVYVQYTLGSGDVKHKFLFPLFYSKENFLLTLTRIWTGIRFKIRNLRSRGSRYVIRQIPCTRDPSECPVAAQGIYPRHRTTAARPNPF